MIIIGGHKSIFEASLRHLYRVKMSYINHTLLKIQRRHFKNRFVDFMAAQIEELLFSDTKRVIKCLNLYHLICGSISMRQ